MVIGPVDPVPEWFNDVLRDGGRSPYGAALVEGLTAYVAAIYRRRSGSRAERTLDADPMSTSYLKPVFTGDGLPPS